MVPEFVFVHHSPTFDLRDCLLSPICLEYSVFHDRFIDLERIALRPSGITTRCSAKSVLPNPPQRRKTDKTGWGTMHNHPHEAYSNYITLFKTISIVSFILQLKSYSLA